MKTAFSSFIYSRRGIYGILHILILLMSLFLVISISIDTFHNIPFLNQGSYLKIQFWICMFFLFDFLLEFFLSKEKGRYFTSIIRKSKFPQNPKRSVRFSGKRTKRSVQKRKARNTQKAETKVL